MESGSSQMGNRRMISKTVTQTQRFLQLPLETQALYFHLIQNADDDGIVEAFPVVRMIGASNDSMGLLHMREFIKPLNDEMVYFIIDFKEQNYIQKDRYHASKYAHLLHGYNLYTERIQTVSPSKAKLSKAKLSKEKIVEEAGSSLQELSDFFSSNFHPISQYELEQLRDFSEGHAYDVIRVAMEEAIQNNARTMKYVAAILNRFTQDNIKTRSDFENSKKSKANSSNKTMGGFK